jgi:hypothetical protein
MLKVRGWHEARHEVLWGDRGAAANEASLHDGLA